MELSCFAMTLGRDSKQKRIYLFSSLHARPEEPRGAESGCMMTISPRLKFSKNGAPSPGPVGLALNVNLEGE